MKPTQRKNTPRKGRDRRVSAFILYVHHESQSGWVKTPQKAEDNGWIYLTKIREEARTYEKNATKTLESDLRQIQWHFPQAFLDAQSLNPGRRISRPAQKHLERVRIQEATLPKAVGEILYNILKRQITELQQLLAAPSLLPTEEWITHKEKSPYRQQLAGFAEQLLDPKAGLNAEGKERLKSHGELDALQRLQTRIETLCASLP